MAYETEFYSVVSKVDWWVSVLVVNWGIHWAGPKAVEMVGHSVRRWA